MPLIVTFLYFVFYVLVFVPCSICWRIFSRQVITTRGDTNSKSYWVEHIGKGFSDMDRQ